MKREIPEGFTRNEIENVVKVWDALDRLVINGVMPDVEMDVTHNDIYTDRWFRIGNAEFVITNEDGEKPHLADVITLYPADIDLDCEETCVDSLREML